ncbi:hypothetical protein N752_09350 [Desulforamulus aquiferis]|nr:C45 family peptidase [Desulforamulus aquiferis]RYD05541.1 hypothetical protein N752_09350 [Desulforamulus aquiferis]
MKHIKKFSIIECKGTSYQIGQQWGEACRENIRYSFDFNIGTIANGYKTPRANVIAVANKYLPKVKEFDPQYIELVKGLAEGADLTFDEVFALRCTLELSLYYNQLTGLCSSFAATGESTQGGKTLLGQNIDWLPGYPIDLLKIYPENGPNQLSLSLGGIVEYTLNSAGFGMCANSLLTSMENFRLNIPIACYLPKLCAKII